MRKEGQPRSFINNTKCRKEDLFKTPLSVSLTKFNYRCLKLQQEACIRKLVLDCNDDDVLFNWLLHIIYMISPYRPLIFSEMSLLEHSH